MPRKIIVENHSSLTGKRALEESLPTCELLLRAEPGGAISSFEEYRARREECRDMFYTEPALLLITRGTGKAITRHHTHRREHQVRVESLMLLPAQLTHGCQPGVGSGFACITLDPAELARCADELELAPSAVTLRPMIGGHDDILIQLMSTMRSVASVGTSQFSRLFLDSLSRSIVARVFETSGERPRIPWIQDKDDAMRRRLRVAIETLNEEPGRDIGIAELAAAVGLSPSHFVRCFKAAVGISPADYQRRKRIELVARLLRRGEFTQQQIADMCGFASVQGMRKAYAKVLGTRMQRGA